MKTLIISASPRDDGNSHVLARSAIDGARSAGPAITFRYYIACPGAATHGPW